MEEKSFSLVLFLVFATCHMPIENIGWDRKNSIFIANSYVRNRYGLTTI